VKIKRLAVRVRGPSQTYIGLLPGDPPDRAPMGDQDGLKKHATLLLHPITQEVYRVPAEALLHDRYAPIWMSSTTFQDLASMGSMSAEKFLRANTPSQTVGFTVHQVMAVRLKSHESDARLEGQAPMYAWASRMQTHILATDWTRETSMGKEFIWMWPPGKAWNAWITRQERHRLYPNDEPICGIDECEPSVRYMSKHPGLMLGPDDIDGCERVPLENLSVAQRLFVTCIKPQQTLFARRSLAQDWTDRITRATNESQKNFSDTMHGAVRQLNSVVKSQPEDNPLPQSCPSSPVAHLTPPIHRRAASAEMTAKERQCYREHMRCMHQPMETHHKRARLHHRSKVASYNLERALWPTDDEDLEREHRQIVQTVQTTWTEQYQKGYERRWGSLPDEVLVNILCLRLQEDLQTSTEAVAKTICTLNRVSKDVRLVTKRFVGAQLATVVEAFAICMNSPHMCGRPHGWRLPNFVIKPSLLSLGQRMRRIGLEPPHVLRLTQSKKCIVARDTEEVVGSHIGMNPASLPPCPQWIPDWRAYLRIRKRHEERVGPRGIVKTPRRPPSGDFADCYMLVRASNPAINGERFASETSGRAHLPDPAFDSILCAAHEQEDALARAGLA
jgi:hypothetical protein